MIVVDTNIISYLLIPNEKYNRDAIRLFEKDKNWIAPSLWYYEFLSVLTLYRRKSIIDTSGCATLYNKALDIVESREPGNMDAVFELIENCTLSSYDCTFLALARETNLTLITEDKKIQSGFPSIAKGMEEYL